MISPEQSSIVSNDEESVNAQRLTNEAVSEYLDYEHLKPIDLTENSSDEQQEIQTLLSIIEQGDAEQIMSSLRNLIFILTPQQKTSLYDIIAEAESSGKDLFGFHFLDQILFFSPEQKAQVIDDYAQFNGSSVVDLNLSQDQIERFINHYLKKRQFNTALSIAEKFGAQLDVDINSLLEGILITCNSYDSLEEELKLANIQIGDLSPAQHQAILNRLITAGEIQDIEAFSYKTNIALSDKQQKQILIKIITEEGHESTNQFINNIGNFSLRQDVGDLLTPQEKQKIIDALLEDSNYRALFNHYQVLNIVPENIIDTILEREHHQHLYHLAHLLKENWT